LQTSAVNTILFQCTLFYALDRDIENDVHLHLLGLNFN